MGKSTNGPDWQDVRMTVSALQSLHGCVTSIELMPVPSNDLLAFEVVVISTWQSTVPLKRNPTLITKRGVLPDDPASAAAHVYGALLAHDEEISRKLYTQGSYL